MEVKIEQKTFLIKLFCDECNEEMKVVFFENGLVNHSCKNGHIACTKRAYPYMSTEEVVVDDQTNKNEEKDGRCNNSSI